MAGKQITDLTSITTLEDTDLLHVRSGTVDNKIAVSDAKQTLGISGLTSSVTTVEGQIDSLQDTNVETTYFAQVDLSQINTLDLSDYEYGVFPGAAGGRVEKNNLAPWVTPDNRDTFLDAVGNKWERVKHPYYINVASARVELETTQFEAGQSVVVANSDEHSAFLIQQSASDDALKASYSTANGYANLKTNPQNMAGMVSSSEILLGAEGAGCFSWWCEPVAFSRFERGHRVMYVGHVDGSTGDQKVTRINLESGKRETKTVWTGFIPDDHNAPAINETDTGKLIIACTGHNDPATGSSATGGEFLHYGVFNTWADVGTLPDSHQFGDAISYAQIVKLAGRIYIFTRQVNTSWFMMISDDHGETWIGSGDPWPASGDGTFKGSLLTSTAQFYIAPRVIDRRESVDHASLSSDIFIRIGIAYNPSSASSPDHNIRTASIRYDKVSGTHYLNIGGVDYAIGTGQKLVSSASTFYTPPAGRTTRLLDVANSSEALMLIIEADDDGADWANPQYKLLAVGADVDIPIDAGESMDWATYYPGAAFVRGATPDSVSSERLEMFVISNEGLAGNHQLYRVVYQSGRFYSYLAQNSQASNGQMARISGVQGALAKGALSRFTQYGPSVPQYRDFQGSFEVISDPHPHFMRPPAWQGLTDSGRWIIHEDGRVEMWGTGSGAALSGTIDLPVHLEFITQVSYDDNASDGGVNMATSGTYASYSAPVRQINWSADVVPSSFSWYVSGVLLYSSGHSAF